jgi:hypothetical protein
VVELSANAGDIDVINNKISINIALREDIMLIARCQPLLNAPLGCFIRLPV